MIPKHGKIVILIKHGKIEILIIRRRARTTLRRCARAAMVNDDGDDACTDTRHGGLGHLVGSCFASRVLASPSPPSRSLRLRLVRFGPRRVEVRRAYRSISLRIHPDKVAERAGPGSPFAAEAEAAFKLVAAAHEVAGSPSAGAPLRTSVCVLPNVGPSWAVSFDIVQVRATHCQHVRRFVKIGNGSAKVGRIRPHLAVFDGILPNSGQFGSKSGHHRATLGQIWPKFVRRRPNLDRPHLTNPVPLSTHICQFGPNLTKCGPRRTAKR